MQEEIADRYLLLYPLGKGGMSEVWMASDKALQREVAVKILRDPLLDKEHIKKRFMKEAALTARLSHPNIVPVFDQGLLEDGRPYIVMEYIEGETLRSREERPMNEEDILSIFEQILSGVEAAHAQGIIHRDLKPDNILIDKSGRVRIFDFGVARDALSPEDETEAGTVIGTARYLSPEQAHGEPADERSDLYAIGIMLYEALAGRTPWEGETALAALVKQSSETASPPSLWNSDVSERLDNIVLRSIAYRRDLRFQSAVEFKEALYRDKEYKTPWRLLLLLIPALFIFAGWWYWEGLRTVPNLQNKTLLEARSELFEEDLQWFSRKSVSEKPAGTIILSSPDAGTSVRKGDTVVLFVSSGPSLATVPDVTGDNLETGLEKIESAGLGSQVRYVASPSSNEIILSSSPQPGDKVPAGTEIVLNVSLLEKKIPDCVGMLERDCLLLLKDWDVRKQQISSNQDAGTVLRQRLLGSREVLLVISSGSEETLVPDITDLSLEEAQESLRLASLGSIVQYQEVSNRFLIGRVLRQSPRPGLPAKGTEVLLVVGRSNENITPSQETVAK